MIIKQRLNNFKYQSNTQLERLHMNQAQDESREKLEEERMLRLATEEGRVEAGEDCSKWHFIVQITLF